MSNLQSLNQPGSGLTLPQGGGDLSQNLSAFNLNPNIMNLISGLTSNPLLSQGPSSIPNPGILNQLTSAASNNQALSKVTSLFGPNIMPIPKNATNTVYVEGIPIDASEREVARNFLFIICIRYLPSLSRL